MTQPEAHETTYEGERPPTWLPGKLFLIVCRGEWPVSVAVCEDHVFDAVERLQARSPGRDVLVYRVDHARVTRVELRAEVVRRSLVPKAARQVRDA
jgi:predicted amidohydrolase